MRSPAIGPVVALLAGTAVGVRSSFALPHVSAAAVLVAAALALLAGRRLHGIRHHVLLASVLFVLGAMHGATARDAALRPSLRTVLDATYGGFLVDAPGVAGAHPPTPLRMRLSEDASDEGDFVSLRAEAVSVQIDGRWRLVTGGVLISVGGVVNHQRAQDWRAGRLVEAPVTFRRPARYLDDGVPDGEQDAALGGIALFGSVKSALLVMPSSRGTVVSEAAARVRVLVRRSIARWVAPHDSVAAAIVVAVLIGDRTGLPDDVRTRLQAAGTYHVIAISGGNIAILAVLIVVLLRVFGLHDRLMAAVAIVALVAYAQVAAAGPSVWRATLMAVCYFGARLFDHRTPPWHATALAAGIMAIVWPLQVRDAGFLLTFGATTALLEAARLAGGRMPGHRVLAWIVASIVASIAAEVALLPVAASVFSRVTAAGVVLNLVAVPVMAVVQIAGLIVVAFDRVAAIASAAGWAAASGAWLLVESARAVDIIPWLVRRVPGPSIWLTAIYYAALIGMLHTARRQVARWSCALLVVAGSLIVIGIGPLHSDRAPAGQLRLTMVDVGQGEAMLLETPDREKVLVDTGGVPFGGGAFDIGGRVVAPALWARGVRRLDALLVTHGDPDHIGGAISVLDDFAPRHVWWGIDVPRHQPSQQLLDHARTRGAPLDLARTGDTITFGSVRLRVLNPPNPDWERQKVRNDDSVVVEVLFGDVAILLTGDISADVERAIAPQLTPAKIRILKVAHHGSRTSSSPVLIDSWRPQLALISCGRGNSFGHPAPEVIDRLMAAGARIYRTDLDGEVTLTSDGQSVVVKTFTGAEK
ncbi:MAG TPA: DNA internalization-related competence protein ComEC/Rec2 [Vicinamibacterales bacterium]|nr:DNA internalization-related competence protein ComEC/Rec2 [Vicinamibacterales bacterium]